ncbi:hypothetical protein DAPPUDRAFT_100142 [Daphnia pulex]|uniref:Uncharacterized protein n=1 Tax=Daphnia pulex TaxID=6669 RepID=E9G9I4_DAPPU|nr:hypothetical protein DAPPUDRAFT_100142 [Daphnia pulex]|eukprot:EFX83571.1 hypothetical protein DAPPUDRAFT_100142 [Daphnia pulex]
MEESIQDSSDDQEDVSYVLANCPSFSSPLVCYSRGFYTSTQYSPSVIDSSQSSNLPRHSNDAEQAPVGVSTPRFVLCQQGDAVQRAWEKLTTIDCRAQCNFNGVRRGKNQKHPLKESVITAALFAGIRANSQFASCTDATLEHETIRSFVRAPEAVRRRGLAAATAVEVEDADRRPQR